MTDPRTAAAQLGLACLIGGVLGLFYGFFRPLRPRHTGAADTLFGLLFCCGWLYWSFGICRGDLHPAGVLGMVLGAAAFVCAYSRTGHLPWCLLIAGIVTGLVSNITGG